MIERQTIKGQNASVIYLDSSFHPTDKDGAYAARVVYDSGSSDLFIFVQKEKKPPPTKDRLIGRYFAQYFRDAFEEGKHKRDEGGKFTSGGKTFEDPVLPGKFVEVDRHDDPKKAVHFIGFKEGDCYHNAVKVFGKPDFYHRVWDLRAKADIAPGDTVVFAKGDDTYTPTAFCYDDSNEPDDPAAEERKHGASKGLNPVTDAFEEGKHKRDKLGKFTGIGSDNREHKLHIEKGHELATRHGFKALRGPEDADMGFTGKEGSKSSGSFTIYEKEEHGKRHLLRFYTKHDWTHMGNQPIWHVDRDSELVASGSYHEGLREYLEKNHKTTDAIHVHPNFKEEEHPRGQPENKGEFVEAPEGLEKKPFLPKPRQSEEEFLAKKKLVLGKKLSHLVYAPNREMWPDHIKNLTPPVPPAWTQTHISMDPKTPLQVLGMDSENRRQPIYLKKFEDSKAADKFAKTKRLLPKFDSLVAKNKKNLSSNNPQIQELAAITALIFEMGLRPGLERDTGAKEQAYGATTLRAEHVHPNDKGLVDLVFTGKDGVHLRLPVGNEQLAADLEDWALKGGQLFPNVNERRLLNYVKTIGGAEFTTKLIRTLVGTRTASDLVAEAPIPKNDSEYTKAVNRIGDIVSAKLGNTRAVCLASYIAPFVFASWAHVAPAPKQAKPKKKAA